MIVKTHYQTALQKTKTLYIDFSKKLLSSARKGNKELMSIFEASFDDNHFTAESFDKEFFLDNARSVYDCNHYLTCFNSYTLL